MLDQNSLCSIDINIVWLFIFSPVAVQKWYNSWLQYCLYSFQRDFWVKKHGPRQTRALLFPFFIRHALYVQSYHIVLIGYRGGGVRGPGGNTKNLRKETWRIIPWQIIMLRRLRLRLIVLVEIPCIFLMYFWPKCAEFTLPSVILCIKFNVFFMLFEPSPNE